MYKVPKIITTRFEIDGNRVRQIAIALPKTGAVYPGFRAGDDGYVQAGGTWLEWIRDPIQIVPGGTGYETVTKQNNWTTGISYQYNSTGRADLVAQGGLFYICKSSHTAGTFATDLAAGKWAVTPWTASAANVTTNGTVTTWDAAIDNCLMTYSGIGPWSATNPTGWRLPNMFEATSIMTLNTNGPSINSTVFPNNAAYTHWCSTTRSASTTQAWFLSWDNGWASYQAKATAGLMCRPVRSLFVS